MSSPIKLDVGCGSFCAEGWTGVDRRKLEGVSIVADMWDIPVESGSIEAIRCVQALEHIPMWRTADTLLEFWRVLKPGGMLIVAVPDLRACAKMFLLEDEYRGRWGRGMMRIFGMVTNEEQVHKQGFDEERLCRCIETCGFAVSKLVAYDDNGTPSIAVEAVKSRQPRDAENILIACAPAAFYFNRALIRGTTEQIQEALDKALGVDNAVTRA